MRRSSPIAALLLGALAFSLSGCSAGPDTPEADDGCSSRYPTRLEVVPSGSAVASDFDDTALCTDALGTRALINDGDRVWALSRATTVYYSTPESGVLHAARPDDTFIAKEDVAVLPAGEVEWQLYAPLDAAWVAETTLVDELKERSSDAATEALSRKGTWNRALITCVRAAYAAVPPLLESDDEADDAVGSALTQTSGGLGCSTAWAQASDAVTPAESEALERASQSIERDGALHSLLGDVVRIGQDLAHVH